MPIEQVIDVNISLAAAVIPEPAFGTSCLLTNLSTRQFAAFQTLSGGADTLKIGAAGRRDTMDTLEIFDGSREFEQIDNHFTGFKTSDELILSYRGTANQDHDQRVVIEEDEPGTGLATVGQYRITASGGPYTYVSPGVEQVISATLEDAGGGLATTGTYTIKDGEGNTVTYVSGTKQTWLVTVATATDSTLYTVVVDGVSYTFTSGVGTTDTLIRDGLISDMTNPLAHPAHPNWIVVTSGTDALNVLTEEFGVAVVLTAVQVELTEVETAEAGELIATAIAAIVPLIVAIPPTTYAVVDASPAITFTANLPGQDLGITVGGRTAGAVTQVITTDHRETVTVVRNALNGLITAGTHPEFTNSTFGTNAIDLEGVVSGVFVDVSVAGPTSSSMTLIEVQSILEKLIAQTSRLTIIPDTSSGPTYAFLGAYTLTLFDVMVSYTATAGDSVTVVRDALDTAITLALPGIVSTATAGSAALDITNLTAGQPFGIALTSPNSNQAATVAVTTASYGIGDDIRRAFDDSSDWYFLLNGFDDNLYLIEGVRAVEALVPGRSHVGQSPDNAIRDTPASVATDVAQQLVDLAFERGSIVYHPLESGEKPYKAPYSQWVSDYAVKLPGATNPSRRRLRGFQFNKYTTQEAANIADKNAGVLDQFKAIDVQAFLGGKSHNGRAFDLIRGLDQTTALVQIAITDLILNQDILPYTVDGINQVGNAITKVFTRLVSQGFAIENSLVLGVPKLSDATPEQQQAGEFPPFTMDFRAQVGTNKVTVNGTISQVTTATVAAAAAA